MKTESLKIKIKGESQEFNFLMPETVEEAVAIMEPKELIKAAQDRCKYLARLNHIRGGRPPREKKIVINPSALTPEARKALIGLGLL